jgi:GxxExxY protein
MKNGRSLAQPVQAVPLLDESSSPETHAIVAAAMEVHRVLGCGFAAEVYKQALAIEFTRRRIPFWKDMPVGVTFRGEALDVATKADFVCASGVVLHLRAARPEAPDDGQVLRHNLAATRLPTGLLMDFSRPSFHMHRVEAPGRSGQPVKSVDRLPPLA